MSSSIVPSTRSCPPLSIRCQSTCKLTSTDSVVFAIVVAAQSLTQIAPQAIQISKAIAAAQELFGIIDRKSEIDSLSPEGLRPAECTGDIKLRNVQFAYPSRPTVPVLSDFTLSIPANKTTALVGTSGSGKSTIVGLVERWYTPTSGSITLDGHDIRDLNVQWLRTNVRLVQQVRSALSKISMAWLTP